VLSFTTAVTVAVEAGIRVYPYRWRDNTAAEFAARNHAVLAVGRSAVNATTPWSLSPAALRRAPFTPRLVLPSPNGSAIAATAHGMPVVAGCLRNAAATARWLTERDFGMDAAPVSVVAAGERWPDDSLRPALEDLLGAGALIAALQQHRAGPLSPEAAAAAACYTGTGDVAVSLSACTSGVELISGGYADDVAIAAAVDSCTTVPVLTDGAFTADPAPPRATD